MSLYYKVLGPGGEACHGGSGTWNLPDGGPGEWMPPIPHPEPCVRGYHLLRRRDIIDWLGPTLWLAEARGEVIADSNKVVVSEARLLCRVEAWDDTSARLFAADCAERVVVLFEDRYPDDLRPRRAIEAARAFARGEITASELAAARAAARDAARAAAGAAARDAARAAAGAAARDAERRWQRSALTRRLGLVALEAEWS